jgi:precorrin-6A/cobalt-precorrin-6A reductase
MIILLAGTLDGRTIAHRLINEGYRVMVTAVSEYGGALAAEGGAEVAIGPLSAQGLGDLIEANGAKVILDCTHPYACRVSKMAQGMAAEKKAVYIRYERPASVEAEVEGVYRAESWQAAAQISAGLGKVIFLTTGSRNLGDFLHHEAMQGKRVIARVLPEPEVIALCRGLGLTPRDIIAMQGPFSLEMNRIMFKEYSAEVIVTKDGGDVGGTGAKLAAARALGIPLVLVNRPPQEYSCVVRNYAETVSILAKITGKEVKGKGGIHD